MPSATKRTLADRVTESLRREILSGVYAPGQKLRPEIELAARFRVNRFTVRAAMNKLEEMHLIARKPRTGTVVLDYSEHASIDVLGDLVLSADGRVNPFVVSHLLEAARVLGAEVAALAADRHDESDLSKLRAVVGKMRHEPRLSAILALDFDFHKALASAASNIAFCLVLNSVRTLLRMYAPLLETLYVDPESILAGYEHVVAAVAAGDAERARSLVRWIWTSRHQRFVDLLENHGQMRPHPAA